MKTTTKYFHQMLKHATVVLLLAGLNLTATFAQRGDNYWTSKGQLIIKGQMDDGLVVNISSKELLILLDYESGKVVMKQKVSDLLTDNDSILSGLSKLQEDYFRFEGRLGLDYINTTGHPPLDFQVEGTMYPGNKHVIGTGHLVHIVQGTSNACLLSLTFQLEINDLFPGLQLESMNKKVYVKVIKSLLARTNE